MIELNNVRKLFGEFVAVDGISLSVKRGEIFGFLGVNGAGKTTTLRMLAGVLQPTSGSLSINGVSLAENPREVKRITGYIPDRPYLYDGLTGREYLHFVSELYDIPRQDSEERILSLLAEYTLGEWQEELIESYSHGMKQRLATCAALVTNPKLLIVDEPMVGLDPHGAKLLKESFRTYAKEGMTIFLSTHSLNVAEEVSDRLAIIHHGKIIAVGTLDELRSRAGSEGSNLEEIFIQITLEGGVPA